MFLVQFLELLIEVAVRETGFPSDHAAADLLTPGMTLAVAVGPSEGVARAS